MAIIIFNQEIFHNLNNEEDKNLVKFICSACNKEFESDAPKKIEYMDPVYGNCWKYISNCPICGLESDEKKELKIQQKKKFSVELTPPCCSGGGGRCCG